MSAAKSVQRFACGVSLLALLSGCGHKEGGETGFAEAAGVTFHAKHGLMVSPATASFIGLQVADVEERKVATALRFSAQVYRAAAETRFASLETKASAALASGSVSARDADQLQEGRTLNAEIEGASLPGRITRLNRGLEKASGQVEVLLSVADAPDRLANGARLSVVVPLGGEQNVVSVPRSALLRTAEGDFVYTASGDYFVRAPIKVGAINAEFVEVADGLYAGDRIVVKPAMTLWLAELQSIRGGQACADGH